MQELQGSINPLATAVARRYNDFLHSYRHNQSLCCVKQDELTERGPKFSSGSALRTGKTEQRGGILAQSRGEA